MFTHFWSTLHALALLLGCSSFGTILRCIILGDIQRKLGQDGKRLRACVRVRVRVRVIDS